MTIRKNFLLDAKIAEHLEKIALKENTTQTEVVRNMIEERYKSISKKEKLDAFYSIKGMSAGSLVGKSIHSIKAEMSSKI